MGKSYIRGKLFLSISFQTRQLECFNEVFNLFYKFKEGKYVKTIKPELFLYMDYIGLAHLIMGSEKFYKNNNLYLKLNSFNILDLVKLINIIKIKYDINCTLITKKNSSLICISNKEIKRLYSILDPYFFDFYKNTKAEARIGTAQIKLFKESPSTAQRLRVFNQVRHFHSMHPRFRISNLERNNFILPLNLKEILIGLLLGDLYIQKFTKNGNTNLQFEQGLVHKDYIFHLYDLFKDYCNAEPRISDRKPDSLAYAHK